jgi:hypothetical protein
MELMRVLEIKHSSRNLARIFHTALEQMKKSLRRSSLDMLAAESPIT